MGSDLEPLLWICRQSLGSWVVVSTLAYPSYLLKLQEVVLPSYGRIASSITSLFSNHAIKPTMYNRMGCCVVFHALLEDVQIYKLNGLSDCSEYSWQGRLPLSDQVERVDKTVAKSFPCRSMVVGSKVGRIHNGCVTELFPRNPNPFVLEIAVNIPWSCSRGEIPRV